MEIPNCFYRVGCKALILDASRTKFAAVLEDNGLWELPGGGLDHGESFAACLARELREEMGLAATRIAVEPSYFLLGRNMKNHWTLNLVFEVEVEHLDFTPSEECRELRFVDAADLAGMPAFRTVTELAAQFDPARHSK